jgi:hypothetical protein
MTSNLSGASSPIAISGWKAREAEAKAKRERSKVDPAVREARARLLERREAAFDAERAAAEAERQDRPDSIRAVFLQASLNDLSDFARTVGQMDGRRLADIASEVLRQRQRVKHIGEAGMPLESAERPARTRGRPKGTSAA